MSDSIAALFQRLTPFRRYKRSATKGERAMTTSEESNQIREAVGVFGDAAAMQKAIEDLLSSGFKHADLSLLASEETVDKKLGHKYKKVTEIEDDAAVPRIRYVSQDAISEGEYVFTGGLVILGALSAAGIIVASGGALVGAFTGAALGAGTWGLLGELLAKFIGAQHAEYVQEQLTHGGLLLWVRCSNLERENSAMEILSRHSGRDVHMHVHALSVSV
jgi:hypothetical protein